MLLDPLPHTHAVGERFVVPNLSYLICDVKL